MYIHFCGSKCGTYNNICKKKKWKFSLVWEFMINQSLNFRTTSCNFSQAFHQSSCHTGLKWNFSHIILLEFVDIIYIPKTWNESEAFKCIVRGRCPWVDDGSYIDLFEYEYFSYYVLIVGFPCFCSKWLTRGYSLTCI